MAQCPQCGAELPPGHPEGAPCPRCVGRGPTAELKAGVSGETLPTAESASFDIRPETNFGPFRIVSELGRGGMGVVYRALEVALGRPVALKVLLAGERATQEQASRFLREARSAANLSHPNIVPVYAAGTEKGVPYFAMEYIEGESLETLAEEPMDVRKAVRIVRDVARALHYSHERGIVHRDVKPGNILIDNSGVPKVTDFGLAKVQGDQTGLTQEGTALGTPGYMSPEQAAGRSEAIGPLSDMFSLGAVFYELLAGRPPFLAETPLHLMAQVQSEDPPPLRRLRDDVSREVQTVCFKALEKEPRARYADLGAMADDLDRLLQGEPILARPPSFPARALRWLKRQRSTALAAAIAVILTGALAGLLAASHDGRTPSPTAGPGVKAEPTAGPKVSEEDRRRASFQMDLGRGFMKRAEKSHLTAQPAGRTGHLRSALEAFEKACEADPQRAEAFVEKGRTLSFLERYRKAMTSFDRAIELNPDLTDAYYGRVQIRYRRYFQARLLSGSKESDRLRGLIEKDLKKIETIGAKPEKSYTGRAVLMTLDGDMDEALEAVEKALEANESFPDAYAARGNIYMLQGMFGNREDRKVLLWKALDNLTTAVRLSGGDTEHRTRRTQILLSLDRPRAALQEAEAVVQAMPDKPFPYVLRAQVRKALGDRKGFEEDMDRADALPYDNPDVHLAVAGAMITGFVTSSGLKDLRPRDVERALTHIDSVLAQYPDRTDILGIRGFALMILGRRKEAIEAIETYLEHHPDSMLSQAFQAALAFLHTGLDIPFASLPKLLASARRLMDASTPEEEEKQLRRVIEALGRPGGPAEVPPEARQGIAVTARVRLARILSERAADRGTDLSAKKRRALREEALRHLQEAARLGFTGLESLAKDGAFDGLRDMPGFEELLGKK